MSALFDLVKHYPVEGEEDAVMQASAEAELKQLWAQLDRYIADNNDVGKLNVDLQEENAVMREALEKISNCPEFEDECYRLARAVLAKYPEEEK